MLTTVDKQVGGGGTLRKHELQDLKTLTSIFLVSVDLQLLIKQIKLNMFILLFFTTYLLLSFSIVQAEKQIWYFIYLALEI